MLKQALFPIIKKLKKELFPALKKIEDAAIKTLPVKKNFNIEKLNIGKINKLMEKLELFFSNTNQWDDVFKKEGITVYPEILPDVADLGNKLKNNALVFDIGCGSGRHVCYLSKQNFQLFGIDYSKTAINECKKWLQKEKLKARLTHGDMYKKLPYPKNFFDAVISIKALHHGTIKEIKNLVKEIERVLKPNSYFLLETPAKQERREGIILLDKNTISPLSGREKGLPHYIFTKRSIKKIFKNFNIVYLKTKESPTSKRPHFIMLSKINENGNKK